MVNQLGLTNTITWAGVDVDTIMADSKLATELWGKQLTFRFEDKVALVAKSGKGKTTAIGIIAGFRTDYTGQISIGDQNLSTISTAQHGQLLQQTLGVVWQDLRLILNLSGLDNILLKHLLIPDPAFRLDQVMAWGEQLGVASVWHKPISQLSYGERQRIAVIRALAAPFKVLLLDEPFSHLDNHNTKLAADLITSVCTIRGAGYILTTLDDNAPLPIDYKVQI